jgi:hypothetical protein
MSELFGFFYQAESKTGRGLVIAAELKRDGQMERFGISLEGEVNETSHFSVPPQGAPQARVLLHTGFQGTRRSGWRETGGRTETER